MTQRSPPRRRRALIVDDETSFGISLETDLHALGYEVCDLATNGQQAFLLAMSDQPDVVLMDVCLEGGREVIEVARQTSHPATTRVTGARLLGPTKGPCMLPQQRDKAAQPRRG